MSKESKHGVAMNKLLTGKKRNLLSLFVLLPAILLLPFMTCYTLAAEANPVKDAEKTRALIIEFKGGLFSINAKETPLGEVLSEVEKQSGFVILIEGSLKSRPVTLSFSSLNIIRTLESITNAAGLGGYGISYKSGSTPGKIGQWVVNKIALADKGGESITQQKIIPPDNQQVEKKTIKAPAAIKKSKIIEKEPFFDKRLNRYVEVAKGEVFVRFPKGVTKEQIEKFHKDKNTQTIKQFEKINTHNLKIPATESVQEFIEKHSLEDQSVYIEPVFLSNLQAIQINDPSFQYQWAIPKIQADKAWDTTNGSSNIIIAVIDTGIDIAHPDLKNNVIQGIDIVNGNSTGIDDNGHGTFVSGIIAAETNNTVGIAGISWKSKLMPVKVIGSTGEGTYSDLIDGIIYAVDHGARVLNLSLGGYSYSQALADAIEYAHSNKAIIVAAGGNENTNEPIYPAAYPNVISVSATDSSDQIWPSSNYGTYIKISAPGVNVLSAQMNNSYGEATGTSVSTAHVSGVGALILSKNPDLSNTQVEQILYQTADDLGEKGLDQLYGYGRVNALKAIEKASIEVHDVAVTGIRIEPETFKVGEATKIIVTVENQGTFVEKNLQLNISINGKPVGVSIVVQKIYPEERVEFSISWLPDAIGQVSIIAELILANDDDTTDNSLKRDAYYYEKDGVATIKFAIKTHRWITEQAVIFLVGKVDKAITDELMQDLYLGKLKDGAEHEDCWALSLWGICDLNNIDVAARWLRHFYRPIDGKGYLLWDNSLVWAGVDATNGDIKDNTTNSYDMYDAIQAYKNNNLSDAYFKLGHVLHLLEDLSLPEHTQLEAHVSDGPLNTDGYEEFVKDQTYENDAGVSPYLQGIVDSMGNASIINYNTFYDYFRNMAKLSYYRNRFQGTLPSSPVNGTAGAGELKRMFPSLKYFLDPDPDNSTLYDGWRIENDGTHTDLYDDGLPDWEMPKIWISPYGTSDQWWETTQFDDNPDAEGYYYIEESHGVAPKFDKGSAVGGSWYPDNPVNDDYKEVPENTNASRNGGGKGKSLAMLMAEDLVPEAIRHVAGAIMLFWKETHPHVNAFNVAPISINVGNSVAITYNVAARLGLKQVELWRTNDIGGVPDPNWPGNPIKTTTLSGQTSYSGSFSDTPTAAGTYWYGLHVVDNAGNWNDEQNSNTGGLPGVYGPKQVTVTSGSTCTDSYEPNESSTSAYGPLSSGSNYSGKICTSTDADWFKINVTSLGTISLSLSVPSSNDYDIELYSPSYSWVAGSSNGTGVSEAITYSAATTGTYYIRVYSPSGSYNATSSYTLSYSFTTATATAPIVTTSTASYTSTSATLNGSVNPNGSSTTAWFEWGTSSTLSTYTSTTASLPFTSTSTVQSTLSALTPSTTYYYRIAASNSAGTSRGTILSFTTSSSSTTQTELITDGSFSSGKTYWTLGGDFWAGTNLTNYKTSPGYAAGGVDSSGSPKNNANGYMYQTVTIPSNATSATLSFWYNITSNETGTTVYDALSVSIQDSAGNYLTIVDAYSNVNKDSAAGSAYYHQKTFDMTAYKGQTVRVYFLATSDSSNPTTFRIDDVSLIATSTSTSTPPTVTTSSASATSTSATLSGSVNPNGSSTNAWFEWSTNSAFSSYNQTSSQSIVSGTTSQAISASLSGLNPSTTYYYRVAASNSAGTNRGSILSFTTSSIPIVTRTLSVASSNPNSGVSITVSPNDNYGYGNGTTSFTRTYNDKTSVTLSAPSTASGNNFQKWQRNGVDYSTSSSTSVTIDANYTMTAIYVTPTVQYFLTTSVNPSGAGSISPSCSGGCWYNSGTSVTLTATANSGYTFSSWSGCDSTSGTTCYVTMNSNKTVTANFTQNPTQYQLTTSVNPAGAGSITPNCSGGCLYNSGTYVQLTALANTGYTFSSWSGCDSVSDTFPFDTCNVYMTSNKSITANYTIVNEPPGEPITLASGLSTAQDIAVDATYAYVTGGNSILKVNLNGGQVTSVASGLQSGELYTLTVDDIYIYFREGTYLKKVGKNGGTVTTLSTGTGVPQDIAVDSTNVYWTERSGGAINKVSKNGGAITTLAIGNFPWDIAVDSTDVYWTEINNPVAVKKVSINGGAVTTLAEGLTVPYGIAVDASNVYFIEYHNGSGTVKKVSKNGGTITSLASGLSGPWDIAVDSANVYWTEYNGGTVKKISINGGTAPTTVASGQGTPYNIAIDSTAIYWTDNNGGSVKKIDKGDTGTVPSSPTGVSTTAGDSQATISWSSVSGATSYNIYWSTTSGVTKTNGTKITGATSPYTHTGRTNGTTYYYVVTAVNSYGESGESSQVSATPTTGITETWAKTYGQNSNSDDKIYSILQTQDGGYVFAGYIYDNTKSGSDVLQVWISKIDDKGNILWQKRFGGGVAKSIQQTPDGGYVVAGSTWPWGAGISDVFVLKLSANGDLLWKKLYGSASDDYAYSIRPTSDGGYILGGSNSNDGWILKIDSTGNVQWEKAYGSVGGDRIYSIKETIDGGFIAVGETYFGSGNQDGWILKLNSIGSIEWQKTYGGTKYDSFLSVQQTTDGGYIVAGRYGDYFGTNPYFGTLWTIKLNTLGDIVWQKIFGDATANNSASAIEQATDGGYIVAGSISYNNNGIWNSLVLKLDAIGSIQWQRTYGRSSGLDLTSSIKHTLDSGYILALNNGFSYFGNNTPSLLLKVDTNGNIGGSCGIIGEANIAAMDTTVTPANSSATSTNTTATVTTTTVTPQDSNATTTTQCSSDTTPPTTTTSPAGGTYNSTQSVTLTCNDGTGSGCDKIYYTTDGTSPTTVSTVYSTPVSISATTTLKFFAKDLAGNSEAVKTEVYTINSDTTPPTGSISINSGAVYTNSTSVTLTLSATDSNGVAQMCISNTTSCSSWETYATSKSWTLSSGDGTKIVYVLFKDNLGNANTSPYSDSIILDTTPPTDGTLTATAENSQISLSWSGFTDATSGIASYKLIYSTSSVPSFCAEGTALSVTGNSYTHKGLTNGTQYHYRLCAIDNAGNTSSGRTEQATPIAPDGASIPPSDTGITGVEREDGGSDNNNLDSTTNNPRIDITYNFGIVIKDPTGNAPQYARLYMTDRSTPSASDFYYVDLVCDSNWAYGATCNYATLLGPAPNHKYYFEANLADGSILRYPLTGEIAGPVVELLTGYNMVSIPRDTNSANMDGSTAFGNSQTYKWVSDGVTTDSNKGSYVLVDSNNPVKPGEGYFTMKGDGITTLPEHGTYTDTLSPTYEITLNPGWNMVSNPYGGNIKLSAIQVQKGSSASVAWADAAANGYVVNAIYYYKGSDWGSAYTFESAGASPDAILVPWFGYWVYLNKNDDTYKIVITRP